MGKRIGEARGEVLLSADILDYCAQHAEGFLAPEPLHPKSGDVLAIKHAGCVPQCAVADEFLARFKAALQALKPGDPMDEATTQGPLSTEGALLQLLVQVKDAVEQGATLLMGVSASPARARSCSRPS